MKRSDVYGLCAVIVAAPHLPIWAAIPLWALWLYRAVKLERQGS